jgi:hypothetical protein
LNFPTKKLFFYFLPIILIGGIFSAWNNARGSSIKNTEGALAVTGNNNLISSDLQSDGKFKDWQSTLASQATTSLSKNPSLRDAENKTENLSKQLFSDYLGLKSSGQANNPEAVQQAADRIAKETDSIKIGVQYVEKDLNIKTSTTLDDQRIYANTVGIIRQNYRDRFANNNSAESYTSASDANFLKDMSFMSLLYASQVKELLKIPVPSNLSDIHLRLINSYEASGSGLAKINLMQSDPLLSIIGFKQFDIESEKEYAILEELKAKLSASGIVFTQDDNASLLWTN